MERTRQTASAGRYFRFVFFSLLLASFSWGCATLPNSDREAESDLSPTRARKIGRIAWVDPAEKIAVVQLSTRNRDPLQTMISRNDVLVRTARLQRSDMERGRSLGVRIIEGLPNVGDEVVLLPDGDLDED